MERGMEFGTEVQSEIWYMTVVVLCDVAMTGARLEPHSSSDGGVV